MEKVPLTGMLPDEIEAALIAHREPPFRARQVVNWVYRKRVERIAQMSNLSVGSRRILEEHHPLRTIEIVRQQGSRDQTWKFLFKLSDGRFIESVVIPANPALYGERSDRQKVRTLEQTQAVVETQAPAALELLCDVGEAGSRDAGEHRRQDMPKI